MRIKLNNFNYIMSFILIGLTFYMCIFTFVNDSINLLNGILLSFLFTILTSILYKFLFTKLASLSKQVEMIIICAFVCLLIAMIFCLTSFKISLIIDIFFIVCTILLTYLLVRKNSNKQNALFTLFLYLLSTPILSLYIDNIPLIMFMLELMIYTLLSIDCNSILRKRNIVRYCLIGMCSSGLIVIDPMYSLLLIPFLIFSLKKIRFNVLFKVFLILFLSGVFGIFIYKVVGLFNLTFIPITALFVSYDKVIISVLFMSFLINFILFRNNNDNSNLNFVILFELLILTIFSVFNVESFVLVIPGMISLIGINASKINYCAFALGIKKYKRPNEIKKVSVVVPNYNYAHYIEKRIDSILHQTYPIYELIILDDMSKDNSDEIIEKKLEEVKIKYPSLIVKYLKNNQNSGNVFKQWAKAFKVATGDYLWIAEADDLSSKYFLNVVMQGFENRNVVMSYTESLAIDQNDRIFKSNLRDWIDIYSTGRWDFDYIKSGYDELKEVMCINNTIANVSSVVFKLLPNVDFEKHLRKSQEFILAGDWYFYSKVLLEGDIAYSRCSLNYHRIHSNSVTHTTDNFIHYNEILTIQNSIQDDVKLPKKSKQRVQDRRKSLQNDMCISKDELYYKDISLKKLVNSKKIKNDILLSIIVPVYNTEKFLKKCFNSFIKTLPEKTEVIVINDGTLDNSEEIILEYVKKYKSIRYIKKENGGLSSVKNMGLKEARGEYIIFLDSDDYVSSNMYSTMLKKAIDKNADIVYSDVLMIYEDGSVHYCNMTNYNRDDPLMQLIDSSLMAASWNKMVKRELYEGLEFPKEFNNEDIAVSPILFLKSKRTIKVESPFYKYVQRSGSIQNSGFSKKRFMVFDTSDILFRNISGYSISQREKVEGAVLTHQILAILMYLISKIENKEERREYIDHFCKRYNSLQKLDNNKYVDEYIKNYKIDLLLKFIDSNDIDSLDKYLQRKAQYF